MQHALRQDPDVIMISELSDPETVALALDAAENGHLVLSTLNAPDATHAIQRLLDFFPPEEHSQMIAQISGVLETVIAQHLIMASDGKRVLTTETLRPNKAIRKAIKNRQLDQLLGLMEIHKSKGNHTIDDSLERLVQKGQLTIDEALLHCRESGRFKV